MAIRRYVVRFADVEHAGPLLECLRYAGIIHFLTSAGADAARRGDRVSFDLYAPRNVDTETWATANASRCRSFGYNAVAAPQQP